MMYRDNHLLNMIPSENDRSYDDDDDSSSEGLLPQNNLHGSGENYFDDYVAEGGGKEPRQRRGGAADQLVNPSSGHDSKGSKKKKANGQRPMLPLGLAEPVAPIQRGPYKTKVADFFLFPLFVISHQTLTFFINFLRSLSWLQLLHHLLPSRRVITNKRQKFPFASVSCGFL